MTDKKKPPMAAAIRAFVAGMKFPTTKSESQTNSILATFTVAMLQFALGMTEGCTAASVSPAISQVAEVIHCSDRTVKRRLKALRELGLLTVRERGHFSTEYTFHQRPVAGTTVDPAAAGTTGGTAKKPSGDRSALQRGQVNRPAGTSPAPAGTTGAPLWGKASGSSLENKPLEKDDCESKSVSFFGSNQIVIPDGDSGVPVGFRLDEAGDLVQIEVSR